MASSSKKTAISVLKRPRERGIALIIVLAFVVLLTGLVVATLTRVTTDRQVSHSSLNQAEADQLALSATDQIISDMKLEIINGSTQAKDNSGNVTYVPSFNVNAVPQKSGNPPLVAGVDPVPNLVRRSVYPDAIAAPGITSRASNINSTSPSANGRAISTTAWNSHYLIPKANTTDDTIPVSDFIAPDWVIVTRIGPASFGGWNSSLKDSASSNYAVGRYAFAIYDEGGLLDVNVAGYPSGPSPTITDIGRKGLVTFADLTALPTTPSGSYVTNTVVDRLVAWRNYRTANVSGAFPSSMVIALITPFTDYYLGNPQRGTTSNFGAVASAPPGSTRTDQAFLTRAELIKLRADSLAGAASMAQYLGTFSREFNTPTWRYNSFPTATNYPLSGRFALSNLSLVAAGANIQPTFGLRWVTTPPFARWQYVGTSGSTLRTSIAPPVAGTTPDFFQILSFARTSSTGIPPSMAETLSLGASIIDQYDSDSTTTVIEYNATGTYAYGMESAIPPVPSTAPATAPASSMLNRPFRNVGEIGYAFKNSNPATSVDFRSAGANIDAGLLDFFTYNTASPRSGSVNINTRNISVLAAVLMGALPTESSSSGLTRAQAVAAATSIVGETTNLTPGHGPSVTRADISRLASTPTSAPFSTDEQNRETVSRALAEATQARTWGLLIDVVAQRGKYSPSSSTLNDFVVEGERRYWVHAAIDRSTGQLIDRQIEIANN